MPDMDVLEGSAEGASHSMDEIHDMIEREVKDVNKSLVIYKHVRDISIRRDEFAKTTTKKIKRYVEL